MPPSFAEVGVADKGRFRRLRKLAKLVRASRFRAALRSRVAAAIEHEHIARGRTFASIIDVGAHHGQFALLAWERFPSARLYCVEPLPDARGKLSAVLAEHPSLTILPFAAAAEAGEVAFHVSKLTDSSSLLPILDSYTSAFPGTAEASVITVKKARLDDLFTSVLSRPTLLKVDVQGGELDALRGAERLLQHVDAVLVECSFIEFYAGQALIDDVIVHLRARNLRLRDVYSIVRDKRGQCLQADLLFERTSE